MNTETTCVEKQPLTDAYLEKMNAYWRAANYLSAAQLYLLDEPMAGLDPLGRRDILDTIDNLRATLGCAVVMVSHSMDDMADRAERVAVLSNGSLLRIGTTAEIFGDAEFLIESGLDVPQVSRLAITLRARGIALPETIYTMDEMELALLKLLGKEARA
mgnify:CR=1 FL=1